MIDLAPCSGKSYRLYSGGRVDKLRAECYKDRIEGFTAFSDSGYQGRQSDAYPCTMKLIKKSIPGVLLVDGDLAALRLDSTEPENRVYLSYAFLTHGPGYRILPAVLLDDWGNEVSHSNLYHWIRENGLRFPRAELFGFDPAGLQTQYFMRDLELFAEYPLYAFADRDSTPDSAVLVRAILLPGEAVDAPQRVATPDDIMFPLSKADVEWWRVNLHQNDLEFLHKPPPGAV